jgi:diamine N-acetyltransferase
MLLRRTVPDDLDGVVGIEECEDTSQWFIRTGREFHEAALEDPDQYHLAFVKPHHDHDSGKTREELVGFAVLAGLAKVGPVELRRMAISPMQRGKGFGRQLLGEVLKLVADDMTDRTMVWLEVKSDHEAAQRLYESVGFELGDPPPGVESERGMSYMHCEL